MSNDLDVQGIAFWSKRGYLERWMITRLSSGADTRKNLAHQL